MTKLTEAQKINSDEINDDTLVIDTKDEVVINGDLSIENIRTCNNANLRINGDFNISNYLYLENLNNIHINGSLYTDKYIKLCNCNITVTEDIISGSHIIFNNSSVINKEGRVETKRSYIQIKNISENEEVKLGDINSQKYVYIKNSDGINCRYIDSIDYIMVENSDDVNCKSINSGQYFDVRSSLVNVKGTVNTELSVKSSDQSILNANNISSNNIIINDTSEINAPNLETDHKSDGDDKSENSIKNKLLSKVNKFEEKQGGNIDRINKKTLVQCIIFKFRNTPIDDADFSNIVQGYEGIEKILQEIETYHDAKEISQSDNSIQFNTRELDNIKRAYHSDINKEVDDGFNDMLNNNSLVDLIDDVNANRKTRSSKEQNEDIYEDFI